jgi:hypothetical protein
MNIEALSGGKSRIIFRSSGGFWNFVPAIAKVFTLLVVVETLKVLKTWKVWRYHSFIAKLPAR